MAVSPIPSGYHSVTPYLVLDGAAKAIEFYKQAFDAEELLRMPMPDGKVAHAEIKIGDSPVMMADESEEFKGPRAFGGTPVSLMIYVEDVDRVFRQALAAGAKQLRPSSTSSTATAAARSSIRSATCGRSPRTSRTCRPKRWTVAWPT